MDHEIVIVIVEDHNHCLEHIHKAIRQRKVFQPWSLLHFDAHPDLSCGTSPALSCFRPTTPSAKIDNELFDFYEYLDRNPSGIAEWILPLVLAGKLKTIDWVRPTFSNQIDLGQYRFKVGAYDKSVVASKSTDTNKSKPLRNDQVSFLDLSPKALLKVDWKHPYFLEDNSAVESDELFLAEEVDLNVIELKDIGKSDMKPLTVNMAKTGTPWILDLCLDYFACFNPWLSDIDDICPLITDTFLKIVRKSEIFIDDMKQDELEHFYATLREALLHPNDSTAQRALSRQFGEEEEIQTMNVATKELHQLLRAYPDAIKVVLEAIPYWHLPHSHESSEESNWDASLQDFACKLSSFLEDMKETATVSSSFPFLITIARSTRDGFTPASVVEKLQDRLLATLERLYGTSLGCALKIVRDYGEWEGSSF